MADELDVVEGDVQLRTKILVGGSVLGAAVGLLGAFMLLNSMQKNKGELQISTSEGLRLGLIITALLRQIYELPAK